MFETIVTKRTNTVRAVGANIRTSPWVIPAVAILTLFLVLP